MNSSDVRRSAGTVTPCHVLRRPLPRPLHHRNLVRRQAVQVVQVVHQAVYFAAGRGVPAAGSPCNTRRSKTALDSGARVVYDKGTET